MFRRETVFGSAGQASISYQHPLILKNSLGANVKVIAGYAGTREVNLAMRKQQLADQDTREQQLRNQESELTNALSAEQARWSEFNARLDELERAIR